MQSSIKNNLYPSKSLILSVPFSNLPVFAHLLPPHSTGCVVSRIQCSCVCKGSDILTSTIDLYIQDTSQMGYAALILLERERITFPDSWGYYRIAVTYHPYRYQVQYLVSVQDFKDVNFIPFHDYKTQYLEELSS